MQKVNGMEFAEFMYTLVEIMVERSSEKAKEVGEPVNGLEVLKDAIANDYGVDVITIPCWDCVAAAKFIVDEDGNLLIPEGNEAQ